jgi:hypothetical protein
LNGAVVVFTLMSNMTSAVPPSNCEPFEKRDDGNSGAILARHDGSLKQTERRDPTIELSASAIYGPKAPELSCGHDSNHVDDLKRVGCSTSESNRNTHVNQSQNPKASHSFLGSGYLEAWVGSQYGQYSIYLLAMVAYAHMGALAQGWTQALAMTPYPSATALPGSWVRVLAMSTMIAYADARALPPHYSSGTGGGGDTASSPNAMENASAPNGEPDPKTHGTSWSLWVALAIVFIGLLGGAEAWATIRGERGRQIRIMGYVFVFTLVVAAAPMVLHQAGGIEAEVNGPLLALWAGAHLNFVLRGALLLRHEQAGYLSPLGYVATLAILSHLVFSTADKPNSRLYTTLTTLAVTVLQDVGLRASFGVSQGP